MTLNILFFICAFGTPAILAQIQSQFTKRKPEQYLKYVCLGVAVKYANFAVVKHMLQHLDTLQMSKILSYTAVLELAVEYGYMDVVEDLIQRNKSDPRAYENYAFRISVQNHNWEMIQYLIQLNDDVQIKAKTQYMADLSDAAEVYLASLKPGDQYYEKDLGSIYRPTRDINYIIKTKKHLLENIIQANPKLEGAPEDLQLSFQYSSQFDWYHLECDINPGDADNEAFRGAARRGDLVMIKYIMGFAESNSEIDPAALGNEPMYNAAGSGHLEVVEYLMGLDVKYNIDPGAIFNRAIVAAAGRGHWKVVNYFLRLDPKYGIDPAVDKNEVLKNAALDYEVETIKFLLALDKKFGIDPARGRNSLFKQAAAHGDLEMLQYLINLGPEYGIEPADDQNSIALSKARRNGHVKVVEYLEELEMRYTHDYASRRW